MIKNIIIILLVIVSVLCGYSYVNRPPYITTGECHDKGGKVETRQVSVSYCPKGKVCTMELIMTEKKVCKFRFSETAIVE